MARSQLVLTAAVAVIVVLAVAISRSRTPNAAIPPTAANTANQARHANQEEHALSAFAQQMESDLMRQQDENVINTHPTPYDPRPHTIVQEVFEIGQRRNLELAVYKGRFLVLTSGRNRGSAIRYDLLTGSVVSNVTDPSLNFHHIAGILFGETMYIVCGFDSVADGLEADRPFINMVNIIDWTVADGPRLPTPRGSCAAVSLNLTISKKEAVLTTGTSPAKLIAMPNTWTEQVICAIAGSSGTHSYGRKMRNFECYSRMTDAFVILPDVPFACDHTDAFVLNSTHIIGLNGVRANYAKTMTDIYVMDFRTGAWASIGKTQRPRSAAATAFYRNRYIITAGGVDFASIGEQRLHPRRSTIEWFDVETGRGGLSAVRLTEVRFATRAVLAELPTGDPARPTQTVFIVCGGTAHGTHDWLDKGTCELIGVHSILPPEARL